MPPSAVVDASILVSAFLFRSSVPGRVVTLGADGVYRMYLSSILLEETRRALLNPRISNRYGHDAGAVNEWSKALKAIATIWLEPLPSIEPVCRDPDDAHVIQAAVAANADWLVTGDRDLLDVTRYGRARIVDPRGFLNHVTEA